MNCPDRARRNENTRPQRVGRWLAEFAVLVLPVTFLAVSGDKIGEVGFVN
jgi:hypothetical protein